MSTKKPLTLQDHKRIGAELAVIRTRLLAIGVEVANSLPKSHFAGKAALRMVQGVDKARCQLDGMVCRLPGGNSFFYYPGVPRVVSDDNGIPF